VNLRRAPIVVLNAAENRQGDKLAGARGRKPQFRTRIGVPWTACEDGVFAEYESCLRECWATT
jgi:hypothetical protein